MICQPCRNRRHHRCKSGTWCDCQHDPRYRLGAFLVAWNESTFGPAGVDIFRRSHPLGLEDGHLTIQAHDEAMAKWLTDHPGIVRAGLARVVGEHTIRAVTVLTPQTDGEAQAGTAPDVPEETAATLVESAGAS